MSGQIVPFAQERAAAQPEWQITELAAQISATTYGFLTLIREFDELAYEEPSKSGVRPPVTNMRGRKWVPQSIMVTE